MKIVVEDLWNIREHGDWDEGGGFSEQALGDLQKKLIQDVDEATENIEGKLGYFEIKNLLKKRFGK